MPHRKPLKVQPANTPHALAAYAFSTMLGWVFLNTAYSKYVTDMVGKAWDDSLMLGLMFSGLVALIAALYSGRVKDPTRGFILEGLSLIPLIAVIGILIVAVVRYYGFETAPTLTLAFAFYNLGHIGREAVIAYQLYKIHKSKKNALIAASQVLADPKG